MNTAFKSLSELKGIFQGYFNQPETYTFFCPARINLLGDYLDTCGGVTISCAVSLGAWILIYPNGQSKLRLRSVNLSSQADLDISELLKSNEGQWFETSVEVFSTFQRAGFNLTSGYDILYYTYMPSSTGLSSSVSLKMVTAFALNKLLNAGYTGIQLVMLTKQVEDHSIRVYRRIADQFALTLGRKDQVLVWDSKVLTWESISISLGKYCLVIVDSNRPMMFDESKYQERNMDCGKALRVLRWVLHIEDLCDITPALLNVSAHLFSDQLIYNRARHIVEENERVKKALIALKQNNLAQFGRLMSKSHSSLRNLYDISNTEIDIIVDFCKQLPYVAGARIIGAECAGCAMVLVEELRFDEFNLFLTEHYKRMVGYLPTIIRSGVEPEVQQW